MKKINTSPRAQARRQRALDRFSVDPARATKDAAYNERKTQELKALQSRLGV